ncbi:hypothetical protein [Dyella mobilis]|uniref:ASCH domain-containing protein n=1 Tax=Dyella mobilis TaxID=1849582 RepID=A0ABS2KI83_9GAMM|nr:hypothetical protein [Dyella mobilis]MBM7130654.1 hypothetical protein [Dyella mobilis]GLQ97279.1 hypothetical protein GCM10007863_16990 [Dyella mobilis]
MKNTILNLTETYLQLVEAPPTLIRRVGLFHREKLPLGDVLEIHSINRDAVTCDEVMIYFSCADDREFLISEFDKNFSNVMKFLREKFPGIENWREVIKGPPFEHRIVTLWKNADGSDPKGA